MGTPEVSVVLPTYNSLPLLRRAVASVITQTFRDRELIVVDDGSTDATRDYLEAIGDARVDRSGSNTTATSHRPEARVAGFAELRSAWFCHEDTRRQPCPRGRIHTS